jgi:hypothetical protein
LKSRVDPKARLQQGADVRITVDLPAELLKRSKAVAEARRIPLSDLMARALEKELDTASVTANGPRTTFPIFSSKEPGTLTSEAVARAEAEEDERRHFGPC